jgi:hypothetical protein
LTKKPLDQVRYTCTAAAAQQTTAAAAVPVDSVCWLCTTTISCKEHKLVRTALIGLQQQQPGLASTSTKLASPGSAVSTSGSFAVFYCACCSCHCGACCSCHCCACCCWCLLPTLSPSAAESVPVSAAVPCNCRRLLSLLLPLSLDQCPCLLLPQRLCPCVSAAVSCHCRVLCVLMHCMLLLSPVIDTVACCY